MTATAAGARDRDLSVPVVRSHKRTLLTALILSFVLRAPDADVVRVLTPTARRHEAARSADVRMAAAIFSRLAKERRRLSGQHDRL